MIRKNYANCTVKTATSQAREDKQAKTPWEVRQGIVGDISHPTPSKNLELWVTSLEAVPGTTSGTESESEQKEVRQGELQKEERSQGQEGMGLDMLSIWGLVQAELQGTDFHELLTGLQLAKEGLEAKLRHAEVESLARTGPKVTKGEGKDMMPSHGDVQPERAKIELNGDFPNVETDPTARGRVKEPSCGPELGRQKRGHQGVQQGIAKKRELPAAKTSQKEGERSRDQREQESSTAGTHKIPQQQRPPQVRLDSSRYIQGKGSKEPGQLEVKHKGSKNYKCGACNATYFTASALRNH